MEPVEALPTFRYEAAHPARKRVLAELWSELGVSWPCRHWHEAQGRSGMFEHVYVQPLCRAKLAYLKALVSRHNGRYCP